MPAKTPRPRRRRPTPWAQLLKRVFSVDVLQCGRCLGPMTLLALISAPDALARILGHLGLPSTSPPIAPATHRSSDLVGVQLDLDDLVPDHDVDDDADARARGAP